MRSSVTRITAKTRASGSLPTVQSPPANMQYNAGRSRWTSRRSSLLSCWQHLQLLWHRTLVTGCSGAWLFTRKSSNTLVSSSNRLYVTAAAHLRSPWSSRIPQLLLGPSCEGCTIMSLFHISIPVAEVEVSGMRIQAPHQTHSF